MQQADIHFIRNILSIRPKSGDDWTFLSILGLSWSINIATNHSTGFQRDCDMLLVYIRVACRVDNPNI